MHKAIIIVGPTGVGKTRISIDLAKSLNTEIISADSMQIYKGMDIGSAKVTPAEAGDIKHYMIDIIEPCEDYSVADYQKDSFKLIKKMNSRENVPIIVGGTGLYINSLTYDLDFNVVSENKEIRKELEKRAETFGTTSIHDYLKKIDPESASRIHPNNLHRIIRSIEIYESTGKKMSSQYGEVQENQGFSSLQFGLRMDRTLLYENINKRVDQMIENGLIEEVIELIKHYPPNCKAFKGIGYREVIDYLFGLTSQKEMIRLIKRNSRRYAKRQLTWFKRDQRIQWIDATDNIVAILENMIARIKSEEFI